MLPWLIAAGLVVALAVLAWVARGSSRALDEIRRGLNDLAEGRTARPARELGPGSVAELAAAFNALAPRLEARISALERERQQLSAVLSGMAEGVVALDGRGRLLFANASADALFGLGRGSVGKLLPELIRSPQLQTAVAATLAGEAPHQTEITLPGRDPMMTRAQGRVIAVHGTPLGGWPPEGAVFVFHDVTELRRLERMRQDFVANVSHELKTPLAAIKAYAETLLDWALRDENVNTRFLRRIEEQADRLDRLIHDLLSLARLESGQDSFDHAPLDLIPVLRSCVEGHRNQAEAKSQTLAFDPVDADTALEVLADEEAIRQIVDNLVSNAIKYTPDGGSVAVRCGGGPEFVEIEVADTGIGIPRDDLPRVFERFYRVDKARSRELGGTGLGLSIVKHLVQSLGGQVTVESRPGAGSRFRVRLPRIAPRVEEGTATRSPAPRGSPPVSQQPSNS